VLRIYRHRLTQLQTIWASVQWFAILKASGGPLFEPTIHIDLTKSLRSLAAASGTV
jgi:hypothetical protein